MRATDAAAIDGRRARHAADGGRRRGRRARRRASGSPPPGAWSASAAAAPTAATAWSRRAGCARSASTRRASSWRRGPTRATRSTPATRPSRPASRSRASAPSATACAAPTWSSTRCSAPAAAASRAARWPRRSAPSATPALPVLALDVPSGVDASTGEVAAVAVTADVTVTFHAAKIGHVVLPGLAHAGAAGRGADRHPGRPWTCRRRPCWSARRRVAGLPPRPPFGSKYDAGNVLAIGGSRGMTGASCSARRAALRAGAGLVVAAVPARSSRSSRAWCWSR